MIENRELTMDDYLAMLRRRAKVILVPAVLGPLAGWLISYAFAPKYTSQALVMVEGQKIPESMVQPVVTEDLTARIATLQQQVLSQSRLQPMLERLGMVRSGQNVDEMVDAIRFNMAVEPVVNVLSQIGGGTKKKGAGQSSPVPGFYVNYTARNPREAQQLCNELTSLLLEENLKSRQDVARRTTELLSQGLEEAKHTLDDMDFKLAG